MMEDPYQLGVVGSGSWCCVRIELGDLRHGVELGAVTEVVGAVINVHSL